MHHKLEEDVVGRWRMNIECTIFSCVKFIRNFLCSNISRYMPTCILDPHFGQSFLMDYFFSFLQSFLFDSVLVQSSEKQHYLQNYNYFQDQPQILTWLMIPTSTYYFLLTNYRLMCTLAKSLASIMCLLSRENQLLVINQ